ncbi:MAG: hypothetical protein IH786_06370 [Proteobacteria bacterium]|nr:hypothetical protein [Pseudomonadota bacterium]
MTSVKRMANRADIDPAQAKDEILAYCKRKGARVVGVADVDVVERIAPAGFGPRDLMTRVKSIIALGVGGQTQGAWGVPAKAMGFFGSTESRGYSIAYGCSVAGIGTPSGGARIVSLSKEREPGRLLVCRGMTLVGVYQSRPGEAVSF